MGHRFQISLARLFVAVTLFAASFGCWVGLFQLSRYIRYADSMLASDLRDLMTGLFVVAWMCPFLAVGVLIKRPWGGLGIGVIVFPAILLLLPAFQSAR